MCDHTNPGRSDSSFQVATSRTWKRPQCASVLIFVGVVKFLKMRKTARQLGRRREVLGKKTGRDSAVEPQSVPKSESNLVGKNRNLNLQEMGLQQSASCCKTHRILPLLDHSPFLKNDSH
jgi:hypothetical protein